MKIGKSVILAAVIGVILTATSVRADPPIAPDEASITAHWQCGLKCGMDRTCYRACLAASKD